MNIFWFKVAMLFKRFDYPESKHWFFMGCYQFSWTLFCGWDFKHALRMGNIYWKFWKSDIPMPK